MKTGKLHWGGVGAALLIIALPGAGAAAPPPARESSVREVRSSFTELGVGGAMSLQGVAATGALNFGIRSDQLVTGGTLHLRMTYSPSLVQDLSHLRVSLNGQTVAAVTLTKAD